MPLISFIIPSFNLPSDYLLECVKSILTLPLSEQEREIILIDDGSDTNQLESLGDLKNQVLFIRQKNSGLSAARNRGIELCTGRFIQFVDGDDALVKEAYAHCIDIIKNDSDADFIKFQMTSNKPSATSLHDDHPVTGTTYMRHNNLQASACSYLFKKSILGELRFTNGIYHEDEEFTPLLMIRSERLIATNAPAYSYRKRPNSITQSIDTSTILKRLDDKQQVLLRLYDIACHQHTDSRTALLRRVYQLEMDYIYNVITDTRSSQQLEQRIAALSNAGLFPLAKANYTSKYKWFHRMSKSKAGRQILLATLPHLKA